MDSMVVGPGLGQDLLMVSSVAEWIRSVKRDSADHVLPLVIDGDGVHVLLQHRDLLAGDGDSSGQFRHNVLITPNAMEFRRLWSTYISKDPAPDFNVPIEEHEQFLKEGE